MVPGWKKPSLPGGTCVEVGQKPMPAPSVYSPLQEAGFHQEPRSIARASSLLPKQAWANFSRDLVAGALMGGVAHTIVAPVERTKLLLQTQDSNMAIMGGHHKRYNGMLDCMTRIVREEGPLSLWRGNGSSVLRYYPSVALNFSCKVADDKLLCRLRAGHRRRKLTGALEPSNLRVPNIAQVMYHLEA